jgi:hypothetical protein
LNCNVEFRAQGASGSAIEHRKRIASGTNLGSPGVAHGGFSARTPRDAEGFAVARRGA